MRRRTHNYSKGPRSDENYNDDEKYVTSGESEWSRDLAVPFDENTVMSERHLILGDDLLDWERLRRQDEEREDYYGVGPKGYRRPDQSIYEDVCNTLWQSPEVDPSEIEVSVDQGVVWLRGIVHRRDFKRWAERLIEHLPGVVDVMNEIKVVKNQRGLFQNRTGLA